MKRILCGDSLNLLKTFDDCSVDLVLTSPPYWKQREYAGIGNEKTEEEYLENLIYVFKECVRIVKDTGSIVFNLGDKYKNGALLLLSYRFAIEASKYAKLINCITWVKKNPFPKTRRKLACSTEPFFVFVKSNRYKFFPEKYQSDKKPFVVKRTDKYGLKYFDVIERSTMSPEQKDRARKELESVIEEVRSGKIMDFRMYCKGVGWEYSTGRKRQKFEKNGFFFIKRTGKTAVKRDVIECATGGGKGHPAVFPEKLVTEIILLLTEEKDLVLDPFVGSGTTAVAAKKLGREFIGIDINPEYCHLAESRVSF